MHGPSVHGLPISHLLPQFGILAPQFGDFLAKLKDFAPKLPHQFGQIGGVQRQKWSTSVSSMIGTLVTQTCPQ